MVFYFWASVEFMLVPLLGILEKASSRKNVTCLPRTVNLYSLILYKRESTTKIQLFSSLRKAKYSGSH
jgi:hypothetical protein